MKKNLSKKEVEELLKKLEILNNIIETNDINMYKNINIECLGLDNATFDSFCLASFRTVELLQNNHFNEVMISGKRMPIKKYIEKMAKALNDYLTLFNLEKENFSEILKYLKESKD